MKVLLIAPVDQFALKDSGYGTHGNNLAKVLVRMKEEGRIEDVYFMNTARLTPGSIPKERVDVSITLVHPHTFLRPSHALEIIQKAIEMSDRKILHIMWETDRLPLVWNTLFERKIFDAYVSPSYFVTSLVKKATDTPVYYGPIYIHIPDIPAVNIEDKVRDENLFTVLYVGQDTARKGIKDAVVSYIRALGQIDDVRMVLKYHRLSDKEVDTQEMIYHATITNSYKPKARVYSITNLLSKEQMYGLYHMSSVLFFPSRGEGFGLPLAESMAAGIPVIYTDWSSCGEVATADGNIPLEYHLDEAVGMFHHGYDIGSKYAIPSITSCMNALTEKYNEWKKDKRAYYGRSLPHRDIIIKKFGFDAVSSCVEHYLNGREGLAPTHIAEVMGYDNDGLSIQDGSRDYGRDNGKVPGKEETETTFVRVAPKPESCSDQPIENCGLVCENRNDGKGTEAGPDNGGDTSDSTGDNQTGYGEVSEPGHSL